MVDCKKKYPFVLLKERTGGERGMGSYSFVWGRGKSRKLSTRGRGGEGGCGLGGGGVVFY